MSELREAAQEALFWMQHARLHLTIKERLHPDGLIQYDNAARNLRAALAQPKTELRDQHKAFAKWFLTQNPIAPSPEDMAWAAWKAALAEPKTELRDQHKAFTHWYFGLRGINEANFNPEYLAWAAWKAALAQPENRPCTCHPDDNPPQPCAQRYALTECKALAQPETTAEPVMWMNRYNATMKTRDRVTANAMGFTTPLYAHPPRDEWRPASEPPDSDRLVIVWVADDRSPSNGGYFCTDCLRPSRANPDARIWASIGVTHWRDVQPPTEGER